MLLYLFQPRPFTPAKDLRGTGRVSACQMMTFPSLGQRAGGSAWHRFPDGAGAGRGAGSLLGALQQPQGQARGEGGGLLFTKSISPFLLRKTGGSDRAREPAREGL